MSHLATALKTNILLESGTNELEVLIFRIGEQRYGVNVAKVREVLEICPVTQTPTNHHAVEGIIQVRNRAIILLNLERYLKPHLTEMPRNSNDIILLLEFNDELLAFRVSAIERIFRISWNKVEPVPAMETLEAPVTSVIRLGGDLVLMLDFEKIAVVANIGNRANEVDKDFDENLEYVADEERIKKLRNFPLVFADDSPTFRMMLHDELTEAGYTNLT
ncbi:MAG: chemotaxis protein CheW, partial [Pirellulaceae bacterium]|nr:chemotaxis protein CheW [Pirellulaceae bacterium]